MIILTESYTIFYKSNGKWKPWGNYPYEIYTLKYILNEYDTIENFLKGVRQQLHKPVKLMRLLWEG